MPHTALGFYRKTQTLECLDAERPKSMDTLRKILRSAVRDIESRVVNMEEIYYGGGTCEEGVNAFVPAMRECMERFSMTSIHSMWQIDDLIHRFTKHGAHYPEHAEAVATLQQFAMRARAFIPAQFDALMADLMLIMKHAQKYFLSFFKGKKDTYLDTAYQYELTGPELTAAIKMHLSDITSMNKAFKAGGLSAKMFGIDSTDISRKCECPDLPILLVFPEACANIRLALQTMNKWIDSDENYTSYIHNDIVELMAKKKAQEKMVKEKQQTYVLVEHHIKVTKKEIRTLDDELRKLHNREVQMEGDINQLREDIGEIQTEITLKEEEKAELRHMIEQHLKRDKANRNRLGSMDVGFLTDKIEAISGEITRQGLTISVIKRQIEGHRNKMRVILDKRELRSKKAKFIKEQEIRKVSARTELSHAEAEFARISQSLDCLKNIHRLRRSSDITAKIFRNLPFEARNTRMLPRRCATSLDLNRKDNLDKASEIVAHLIGADWPRLYWALPFFPDRGEELLDTDVDDIVKNGYRSAAEFQALEALRRWRRLNAHSSLAELKDTLKQLGKFDILVKLDYFMNYTWPKTREEGEDDKYPYDTQALKRFMSISPLRASTMLDASLTL